MRTFKKILFADLKAAGLGDLIKKIKSVRTSSYSGGSSASISCKDLFAQEREQLKAVAGKYQYGHFDGMQDLYEYSNSNKDLEVQYKFVFVENEFSPAVDKAVDIYLEKVWQITDDKTCQDRMHCWKQDAVWRIKAKLVSFDQVIDLVDGNFQEQF